MLIVGTTIAGGMLALPIATSQLGFIYSTLLFIVCWFVMTASAFLILEINLWLPRNSNIISMAKATLGKPGQVIAWITYLLLLYSLLAAYISGGGDFLHNFLSNLNIHISISLASILFTVMLGYVVHTGIRLVDYVNRSLMLTKLAAYLLLIALIFPHVSANKLIGGGIYSFTSVTVVLSAFGFAIIVPSLRTYFHDDKINYVAPS